LYIGMHIYIYIYIKPVAVVMACCGSCLLGGLRGAGGTAGLRCVARARAMRSRLLSRPQFCARGAPTGFAPRRPGGANASHSWRTSGSGPKCSTRTGACSWRCCVVGIFGDISACRGTTWKNLAVRSTEAPSCETYILYYLQYTST